MLKTFFALISLTISTNVYAMKIVTIDHDPTDCLSKITTAIPITKAGLADATKIAKQMEATLLPLMPAAGLAAPQIGISKQIFIYSWDRTPEHLEVVINPTFTPVGEEAISSWEACFSAMSSEGKIKAAFLKRYKKIVVTYTDLKGKMRRKTLEDFAAKVFQHEYDHLQGIVNVHHKDAMVKTFNSKEEMTEFMIHVKKKDSLNYAVPTE